MIPPAMAAFFADPSKKKWGSFGLVGLLGLLGNTLSFAAHQMRWCGPKPSCCGGR